MSGSTRKSRPMSPASHNIQARCETQSKPRGGWVWSSPPLEELTAAFEIQRLFPPLPLDVLMPRSRNAPRPTISNASLIARCMKWLLEYDPHGSIKRSQLLHDARIKFGDAMTTRIFAEAYDRVYQRKRGRPFKRI